MGEPIFRSTEATLARIWGLAPPGLPAFSLKNSFPKIHHPTISLQHSLQGCARFLKQYFCQFGQIFVTRCRDNFIYGKKRLNPGSAYNSLAAIA
jgi:hypothetical protein